MTFTSAQPDDSATIPISSDYSPQNNAFYALPGAPGGYLDAFGNTSSPAVMSFAVPLITQKNSGITGAASTSLVIPFFYPNIAGNSIVVSLGLGVTLGPNIVLSVTDSVGNIYQQAGLAAQGNGLTAAIFYATKIGLDIGTPNVVTVSISGSGALAGTSIAATIYEIPGLIFASNALDQVATGSSASSSQASTSAVSPVSPNQLAVMAVATGGTQITPVQGWSADSGSVFPVGGSSFQTFSSQSQLLPTIAQITPQATLFPATSWCAALATFRSIILPVEGTFQVGGVQANLSQSNQIPVSNSAPQGPLTVVVPSGGLVAGKDTILTFTNAQGVAAQARRIRIQNESAGPIYWNTDAIASTGSASLAAPGANAVSAEWINVQSTQLHIFVPTGGTTLLNAIGGVKVLAYL